MIVEIRWLQLLAEHGQLTGLPKLSGEANQVLNNLLKIFLIKMRYA